MKQASHSIPAPPRQGVDPQHESLTHLDDKMLLTRAYHVKADSQDPAAFRID